VHYVASRYRSGGVSSSIELMIVRNRFSKTGSSMATQIKQRNAFYISSQAKMARRGGHGGGGHSHNPRFHSTVLSEDMDVDDMIQPSHDEMMVAWNQEQTVALAAVSAPPHQEYQGHPFQDAAGRMVRQGNVCLICGNHEHTIMACPRRVHGPSIPGPPPTGSGSGGASGSGSGAGSGTGRGNHSGTRGGYRGSRCAHQW
jgi:hypothetical protein